MILVLPAVAVMLRVVTVILRTVIWKYHFTMVPLYRSLSPSSTVSGGYFRHHSKNSSPKIGPITPERNFHAGCICE